jgi:acyl carrier protein
MDPGFYAEFLKEKHGRPAGPIPPAGSTAINLGEKTLRSESPLASESSSVLEEILVLPAASREAALFRITADIVRRTLGLRAGEEIDPDKPLNDLGMDSLLAIELRNSLSVVLHRQFASTILFDYPTLRVLVAYLQGELPSSTSSAVHGEERPRARPVHRREEDVLGILDAIEQMSDEEVESSFD